MSELQRFCWTQHGMRIVSDGMRIVSDGEWYKREDIDAAIEEYKAEIARLLLRIADLEAAEPVSAVLQAQIDDVAEATVDCPIPSSMDVRRHPITQCLIAAILDNARLREALERVTRERDEEKEIVSRVWEILGSPSFASLRGRSIYDLLQETISARKDAQADNARLRERETILNTMNANLHDEIDKARKREREVYNRLDWVMAYITPRREDEHD